MNNFWKNYELYRDKAGMRDADVCRTGNLSKATLSHSKGQGLTPKLDTAFKISSALRVSLETLITGIEAQDEYLYKRIKYDDEFKEAVNQLARLQDKERYKVYGVIDNYSRETSEEVKRESETG